MSSAFRHALGDLQSLSFEQRMQRGAENAVRCMGVTAQDRVFIITDYERESIAHRPAAVASHGHLLYRHRATGKDHLPYVKTFPQRLTCDAVFICDTGMPAQDIPALAIGERGIIFTEEVQGARHDLHSGEVFTLFERTVKEMAPVDVTVQVHYLYGGVGLLVSPDTPAMAAAEALKETYEKEPLFLREGGSNPIAALFHELLGAPVVLMGFALPDDNPARAKREVLTQPVLQGHSHRRKFLAEIRIRASPLEDFVFGELKNRLREMC